MRLIDADALIGQMEADAEQMEDPIAKMFTYAAISDIKHAPTVEPEHKTGKWNVYYHDYNDFSYSCNWCGYSAPYNLAGGVYKQKKWAFCPNCGARMGADK
jgi:rubrerythrin